MDELEGQFEHEAWQVVVKNSMGMEAVEYLHQIGATTLKHLTQLDDEDFAALFDKKKAWKKTFIESVQQAWNAQDTAFSSPSDPSGTATPSSHLSTSGTASHFDRPFAVDKVQRNHGGERPPEHVCPLGATLFRKDFQKEFTYAGKTFQGGYLPPEADMLLDTHNGEGGLCGKQWRTVICCTAWWIGLPFAFVWDRIPRDAPVRELDCRIQISTGMTKDDMQACGYTTYNSLRNKMNDIRKGKGVNMGFPPSIESFFQQQDPRIPQNFLEAYLQRRGEAPGAFAKMMADVLGNAQAVVDSRVNSSLQKTAKILSTAGPEETHAPGAAASAVQYIRGGGSDDEVDLDQLPALSCVPGMSERPANTHAPAPKKTKIVVSESDEEEAEPNKPNNDVAPPSGGAPKTDAKPSAPSRASGPSSNLAAFVMSMGSSEADEASVTDVQGQESSDAHPPSKPHSKATGILF